MSPSIPKELKKTFLDSLKKDKAVCMTGAGISAESGIPTFRGKGGLWEKYDPHTFANLEGLVSLLRKRPRDLAKFIIDFYSILLKAGPNPAHSAIARLQQAGIISAVITQNIDNLHQEAGSRDVIEVHGNALRIICMGCQKKVALKKDKIEEFLRELKAEGYSYMKVLKVLTNYFPRCDCGCRYRIDVVLFGEMLPQDELLRAYSALDNCSTLLIIGSSLVVYPAAGLPLYAKKRGVKLIEINNEETPLSQICDYKIRGRASEVLPEILELVRI